MAGTEKIYAKGLSRKEYIRSWIKTPAGARYLRSKNDQQKRRAKEGRIVAVGLTRKEYQNKWYHDNKIRISEKRYGLFSGGYATLLEAQKGCCAICGSMHPGRNKTIFCIDHDHATGKVRGLLCDDCNSLVGLAKDRPDTLVSAAKYLEKTI